MATDILLNLSNQQSFSTSPSDIFKSILEQLNEWITFIPNLFRSLLAKIDEAFPPEARAHWLAVATRFAVAALGVVLLCLICWFCGSVIIRCIIWVIVAIRNLISGFIRLLWIIIYNVTLTIWKLISGFVRVLWNIIYKVTVTIWKLVRGFIRQLWIMIKSVFRVCTCCGRRSAKMMTAPGTGGVLRISRATFESNPASYFRGLRAGLPVYVS